MYNPSASSTSRDLHKNFTLEYGGGGIVTGEQYTDVVKIAGLTVRVLLFFLFFNDKKCLHVTIGGLPDAWCCRPV